MDTIVFNNGDVLVNNNNEEENNDIENNKKSEEDRFTCQDCGNPDYDMYMVNDDIWDKYGNKTDTLCMGCLEKRMGRSLTKHDFSQHKKIIDHEHSILLSFLMIIFLLILIGPVTYSRVTVLISFILLMSFF